MDDETMTFEEGEYRIDCHVHGAVLIRMDDEEWELTEEEFERIIEKRALILDKKVK